MSLEPGDWPHSLLDPPAFILSACAIIISVLPRNSKRTAHILCSADLVKTRFHVMWYLLFQEFKPANFLEIGVFRGQNH